MHLLIALMGCGPAEHTPLQRSDATRQASGANGDADQDNDGDGQCENGKPLSGASINCPESGAFDAALEDCDDNRDDTFYRTGTNETPADGCYQDEDGDGFGAITPDCATAGTDCDDTATGAAINPDATEICNLIDDDCANGVDDGITPIFTYHEDSEPDGFGDPDSAQMACMPPPGFVLDNTDCDPTRDDTFPGAAELDSLTLCMQDEDHDGYGSKTPEDASAAIGTDCDDMDPGSSPSPEVCNGLDDDCNGTVDDGFDLDHDGVTTCGGDCDDTNPLEFPGNTQIDVLDGHDNDCSSPTGTGDECYADVDMDGFGVDVKIDSPNGTCLQADGESGADITDCDDSTALARPGGSVVVDDGLDNDCSHGAGTDECYVDGDDDDHGTTAFVHSPNLSCGQTGEADVADDCDDSNPDEYPGNTVVPGDGHDNDCSDPAGVGDECYVDADQDTYGTGVEVDSTGAACDVLFNEAVRSGDCDETSTDSHLAFPGGTIVVNDGLDNDCSNGIGTDECFVDSDGDDWGASTTVNSNNLNCTNNGEAEVDGDCRDSDPATFPGAAQLESTTACSTDVDDDGYGDSTPVAGVIAGTDCDDDVHTTFLGAPESCNFVDDDCDGERDNGFDVDGDGVTICGTNPSDPSDDDCDDNEPNESPLLTEIPNDGYDNDCSNNGVGDACYRDNDQDGFGIATLIDSADTDCLDDFESDNSLDCLDGDPFTFPGAAENEVADCMSDADEDGFGSDNPAAGVTPGSDCDDTRHTVFFGATETCNAIDDDCDVLVDEDFDEDGDTVTTCGPDGDIHAEHDNDCNDHVANISPIANEICDLLDNDCDNEVDENVTSPWYLDADEDGFGDPDVFIDECAPPLPYVADNTDCDDTMHSVNPNAVEIVADGIDQDCDGSDACYVDHDEDGFGTGLPVDGVDCGSLGFSGVNTDCDDDNPARFPGNGETCDGIDNDCLNGVDDHLVFIDYYPDIDGDGFGDRLAAAVNACDGGPAAHVADNTDCNDGESSIRPGAPEVPANGIDEDCDLTDDCYPDDDGDSFGRADVLPGDDMVCTGPGEASVFGDCDDTDPTEYPGQAWYADCDGDGISSATLLIACEETEANGLAQCTPIGPYVNVPPAEGDCDDNDPLEFPGQVWYADCDEDGSYQVPAFVECAAEDIPTPCDSGLPPPVWVHDEPLVADCDDEMEARSPLRFEICEPFGQTQIDNDCDDDVNGQGENGGPPENALEFHADVDLDGFGAPGDVVLACEAAPGLVPNDADCDDLDPTIFTGAEEVCDGRDQNCNQLVDEPDFLAAENSFCIDLYRDLDGDGYGDQGATECLCVDLSGELMVEYDNELYVATFSDCDDLHADIKPHECNDGSDNDSDQTVDSVDEDCQPRMIDGRMRQPTTEGPGGVEYVYEVLDGHDNDCDGFVPYIELDCDDDGSLPALPIQPTEPFGSAEDVGLAECSGPPIQVACWDETLTLECDTLSGLWVTRWGASEDGFGGRYSRAYRNLNSGACDRAGDCDDHCAARCPGAAEACDGLDNDCSGVSSEPDTDGIPAALDGSLIVGTTSPAEVDFDGDGFAACLDDFRPADAQTTPSFAACTSTVEEGRDSDCDDGCYLANDLATEQCNGFRDVCGSGATEGLDADQDGHRTCGVGGPVESELVETFFSVVWVSCADGREGCEGITPATDTPAWVPLLLPRPDADACDAPLEAAVESVLRTIGLSIADLDRERDLADVCVPESGGICTVVSLQNHTSVDSPEWLTSADATCESRPELYHSRSVWPAERIVASRETVVEAECMRLFGVRCDAVVSDALATGSNIPPNIDDLLETPEVWWQELGRYLPTSNLGAVMTCWGDPDALEDDVGGDCADTRATAHRDNPEGPDDLLGLYLGDPGDCDRCVDGIDNNCDGLTDCEDSSCARCFVGESRGCRGTRDPCADEEGGCQTGGGEMGVLVFLGLLARLRLRRER